MSVEKMIFFEAIKNFSEINNIFKANKNLIKGW